jgi:bacterioferritin-associated ferredoxin
VSEFTREALAADAGRCWRLAREALAADAGRCWRLAREALAADAGRCWRLAWEALAADAGRCWRLAWDVRQSTIPAPRDYFCISLLQCAARGIRLDAVESINGHGARNNGKK